MNWKPGTPLRADQTELPILWWEFRDLPEALPDLSDEVFLRLFGGGRNQRIKTWGHDANGVHWLSTRNGTPMHTDPAYARYTHHLTMRNDAFRLHGLAAEVDYPVLVPGVMLCLDTHSPHQVSPDPRLAAQAKLLGTGFKIALAVDSPEPIEPEIAWTLLSSRLSDASPLEYLDRPHPSGKALIAP